jgi:photosystem II stability/assembly factor-like uncharacterized protein
VLTVLGTALASLLLLSGAQSGVQAPGAGWYSGNPLLGPSTLTSLASAGGTTYAAGNEGVLLKSTDGGLTWSGIATGIQDNLSIVQIVGGDPNSIVVGGATFLRRSDNGGKTFTRLPFARGSAGLVTAAFPSSEIGYLVLSNGFVLSTADGGRTFTRKTAIPGGKPTDIIAPSSSTLFAVTSGPSGGTIQRTIDGAESWTQIASVPFALKGIAKADATTMYAVGPNINAGFWSLLKSVDGGTIWNQKNVFGVPPADLTSIRTAGPDVALVTTNGNQLLRTTDGGDTFAAIAPSSDPTSALAFVTPTRAVAVGAFGSAEISDDAGANWTTIGSRIPGPFTVLCAGSDLVAYAGGAQGVLARTGDGGQTWANVSPPTTESIVGIAAPSATRLFVLASDGSLQRSDNGGVSYRILNTGTAETSKAVLALDNETILLIGPRGLLRSTNGGEVFEPVKGKIGRTALLRAGDHVGGRVYAYGGQTFVTSSNAGATWKAVKRPAKRSILDVSFGTATTGYLVDTRRELWRTANGGRNWSKIENLGAWRLNGVDFADAKHGFALVMPTGRYVAGGYLLRTDNGGKSWHPQFVSGGPASAIESADSTNYLLVGDSVLYATKSGGDMGATRKLTFSAQPKLLRKSATVTIKGRLSPAHGGEDVALSRYMAGSWTVKHVTVASNGAFSTRWPVTKTAVFVAQAFGDADHVGVGTAALTVKLVPKKR